MSPKAAGITWQVVGTTLGVLLLALGGWAVQRTTGDIDAVRKEFRAEIETFKRDRTSDLSRLSSLEAKLDGLRESVARTETKIDVLVSAQQGRARR